MTNDLIKLTEDFYHRREYRQCVETARVAIEELPGSITARDYLIRALIQDGLWDLAKFELEVLKKFAPMRDYFFLNGFLHRKQGDIKSALSHFLEAEKLGRAGVASKREIANCYFLLDNLLEAKRYVQEAIEIKENRFVLDLSVQIATREGDEATARQYLKRLESFDATSFVQHRLSTVELQFGTTKNALLAAKAAVEAAEGGKPSFGMLAQLVTCLTRAGEYEEADISLLRLNKLYGNQRSDVRLGLACRLEVERGRYAKALQIFDEIKDTHAAVYKAMKRDALDGYLRSTVVSDKNRDLFVSELQKLDKLLSAYDLSGAWLALVQ